MSATQIVRFEPDPDGIRKVHSLPGMVKAIENIAKRIARDAQADAPSPRIGKTYRATSATVSFDGVPGAIVHSVYPFAHIVEFGSVNNPPYRTLTRAAMKYGDWEGDMA